MNRTKLTDDELVLATYIINDLLNGGSALSLLIAMRPEVSAHILDYIWGRLTSKAKKRMGKQLLLVQVFDAPKDDTSINLFRPEIFEEAKGHE